MQNNAKKRQRLPMIDRLESRSYMSITFAAPTFSTGVDSVTGIATGSLKNNGLADVVVAGIKPGSTPAQAVVGVYLNKGGGSFDAPTVFNFNGSPGGVALGDFLNNGRLDIAVIDSTNNTLNVFLNNGSGGFTPGVGAGIGGTGGATAVATGDFNGDGKSDVVVVDGPNNTVAAFISRGDEFASFVGGSTVSVPTPTRVVVADFNGDGHPDLAIASGASPGAIYIAINDGNANFGTPASYAIGTDIQAVTDLAVADFTGDGHPDIVGLGTQAGTNIGVAGVLPNNGNGTFGAVVSNSVSSGAVAVGAADLAGTGHIDIASIISTGGLDFVQANGAFLGFDAAQHVFTTELGATGNQAVTPDINGDGKPDIAFLSAAGGFGVALNTSGGNFPPPVTNFTSPLVPVVAGVLPTTPVVAGVKTRPIRQRVTVTNTGTTPIDGKVIINLLLSSSKTGNAGDPTVAQFVRNRLKFNRGQSRTFIMTVRQLPASAVGPFFLVAQVTDPTQQINAGSSSAAISVVAPTVDLSGNFVLIPATAQVGRRANLAFNVTNAGTIPALGLLDAKVFASQNGIIDANSVQLADVPRHISIGAGKTLRLRLTKPFPAAPAGPYFLIVQLDPANVLHDVNISNNVLISATAVTLG